MGYLPDMFGHISQMPQLLAGFGLDNAIIFRGLSDARLKSELWWDAPDGTRVLAFHLPYHGAYSNAAFFYHSLPAEAKTLPAGTPGGHVVVEDIDFTVGALRHIADHAIKRSRSGHLLFMNGVDHMEPQPQIPEIIRRANAKYADFETVHATMEQCLDAVRANSPSDLQTVKGELRSTAMVARASRRREAAGVSRRWPPSPKWTRVP